MLLKMQSQTRLIQEAQGVGDPRMLLLRLRTTTTLLPAASTIATSKNLFIARRYRRSSLGVLDAAEEANTPRYSTIFSKSLSTESNRFCSSSVAPVLARRSTPSWLGAWFTLVPHFTLQFSASSERVLRTSSRLPFCRRVLTVSYERTF